MAGTDPRFITFEEAESRYGGGGSNTATVVLHSSGDNTDNSTFTADNSGIKQLDKNGVECLRVWTDGTVGGDILIVDQIPPGFLPGSASDNVFIGTQIAQSATSPSGNVAIGNSALQLLTTGSSNTAVGADTGNNTVTGSDNTFIGNQAGGFSGTDISQGTFIGSGAAPSVTPTQNAIAIGYSTTVSSDNTAVIGNASLTDLFAGQSAQAIIHGKGDAIVFPDSDPHVAGAAYWVAGVLTKSAG